MAYTPKQLQDNQDEQGKGPYAPMGPTVSAPALGSTPSVGGTVAGQAFVNQPPSQASGKTPGTGFVNIDKYLGANKNAGSDLKQAASGVSNKESSVFRGAKQNFMNDVSRGSSNAQPIDVNGIINNILGPNQSALATGAAQAGKALSEKYTGPTQFNYDVAGSKQIQQLNALSNANTAGMQLADLGGPLAKYNPGLSAIDQAIYGSNPSSLHDVHNMQTNLQASEKGQIQGAEKKAAGVASRVESQKAELRNRLGQAAQGIMSGAQGRANAANAQEAYDQSHNIVRDPTTGQVVSTGAQVNPYDKLVWEGGTGQAQANQFLGGSDITQLQTIGGLLGDQTLAGTAQGNPYQSGRYAVDKSGRPLPVTNTTAVQETTALDPEERKKALAKLAAKGQ